MVPRLKDAASDSLSSTIMYISVKSGGECFPNAEAIIATRQERESMQDFIHEFITDWPQAASSSASPSGNWTSNTQ